jgi:hypothetical protein
VLLSLLQNLASPAVEWPHRTAGFPLMIDFACVSCMAHRNRRRRRRTSQPIVRPQNHAMLGCTSLSTTLARSTLPLSLRRATLTCCKSCPPPPYLVVSEAVLLYITLPPLVSAVLCHPLPCLLSLFPFSLLSHFLFHHEVLSTRSCGRCPVEL